MRRALHCSTSRVRFLTLDLCYLKQQTQLPTSRSELWIFHLAGQHEFAATIICCYSPLESPRHPNAHVYFILWPFLEAKCIGRAPSLAREGAERGLHLSLRWAVCPDACNILRGTFLCRSAHCRCSLFKGDFLSSQLSNLRYNELNSSPLFRECTFPEQSREELFKWRNLLAEPSIALGTKSRSQSWGAECSFLCH